MKAAAKLTREQRKLLESRINRVAGWQARNKVADAAEPVEGPEVRKARAILKRHEAARRRARDAADSHVKKAYDAATEKLLFGTPDEALAAVVALEKKFGSFV